MKKKNLVKAAVLTNPFVYIVGIPFSAGILLAGMFGGVYKNTRKIVNNINKDLE